MDITVLALSSLSILISLTVLIVILRRPRQKDPSGPVEASERRLLDALSRAQERQERQLEQVYRGIGEMQTLAGGVNDLKKVLSGIKTRGILGEIQLGAILGEILSPEQYELNVAVDPASRQTVEYAVKMPGGGDGPVWLPIDSKFPFDRYAALRDAHETGDKDAIDTAAAFLRTSLRQSAKEIRDKYITPPYTTEFAVLFLPFEGLYAEAVRYGMIEELMAEFRVSIAGPSTMGALLNSLQMGFRTLAIQKRSGEVWAVLGQVKGEFEKFSEGLDKIKRHLELAGKELDNLSGTRTRGVLRSLNKVETDHNDDLLT